MSEQPRPFHQWHEDHGDVLWYRNPICEPPYFGSPICLGRTMVVEIMIGREHFELPARQTGGWPFDQEDERHLWWVPGPNGNAVQAAINVLVAREDHHDAV